LSERADDRADDRADEHIDERADERIDERADERIDERIDTRIQCRKWAVPNVGVPGGESWRRILWPSFEWAGRKFVGVF
jgi:hypothetical protein